MEEGFELTQEIKDMARGYDAYYMYIDSYGQMKDALSGRVSEVD